MKKDLTEMVFILDRSGSMHGLEEDTIGGFNSMIDKQKKEEGEALVSTVLFSDHSEVIHDRVALDRIEPMTDRQYVVGGCTALLDAVGDAVKHISTVHRYIREEDCPGKTVFVIITDGMENASRRWSGKEVRKLVEQKKELGWEFLFLGANIDAAAAAGSIGIGRDRSVTFKNDSAGQALNYHVLNEAFCQMRACGSIPDDWSREIEDRNKS